MQPSLFRVLLLDVPTPPTGFAWGEFIKNWSPLIGVLLFLAGRYFSRKDKASDEQKADEKAALKARNERADSEREAARKELHELTNKITLIDNRLTALNQADERISGQHLLLENRVNELSNKVQRNEMGIEGVKEGLNRQENTIRELLGKILERLLPGNQKQLPS